MLSYQFNFRNSYASNGVALALQKMQLTLPPVVLCIGSDLVAGDSLGPTTGTLLCHAKGRDNLFVLGSLKTPVTAKEVKYLNYFCKATFPDRPILTVDAAVGNEEEVGLIRVTKSSLRPGSGINKDLGSIGDICIQGIVAERGLFSLTTLQEVRLHMVYRMAEIISQGILCYHQNQC